MDDKCKLDITKHLRLYLVLPLVRLSENILNQLRAFIS